MSRKTLNHLNHPEPGHPESQVPANQRSRIDTIYAKRQVDSSDDTPGGRMQFWTWQQIIFIDPDNRPRDRKLIVQIVGGVIHAAFFGSIRTEWGL